MPRRSHVEAVLTHSGGATQHIEAAQQRGGLECRRM